MGTVLVNSIKHLATQLIQSKENKKVTNIELEDGSGRCFIYQLEGSNAWKFIRL